MAAIKPRSRARFNSFDGGAPSAALDRDLDRPALGIPCTLLVSGFGVVEKQEHVVGASIRAPGNKLALVGLASSGLAGSVFARSITANARDEVSFPRPPQFNEEEAFAAYERYHELVKRGVVLSAHDVSEGGLAVALAEMGFSGKAGLHVDLATVPTVDECPVAEHLFGETPGRIIFEIEEKHVRRVEDAGFTIIGETTSDGHLTIGNGAQHLVHLKLSDLKPIWQNGLVEYY
jgi:phosphoribosylformylglycinamidine synthase